MQLPLPRDHSKSDLTVQWLQCLINQCEIKGCFMSTPYSTHDFYTELQSMRTNNKVCVTKQECLQAQTPIGFAAFQAACVNMAQVPQGYACVQPKREFTMMDQEIDQRLYILDRTRSLQCRKDRALEEFFGLRDDTSPATPEDLIKRIQDGKYVVTSKDAFNDDEDDFCGYSYDRLHWRDPAKVRDQAGYKAAEKNLKAAVEKLNDKARLYTIADATKAFEEFEATDFTTVH